MFDNYNYSKSISNLQYGGSEIPEGENDPNTQE
jgi:hypothetical protein